MSIFKYLFDSEWNQRSDIESLKSKQRRTTQFHGSRYRQNKAKLEEVENDVGELALYCRTAVTLMVEKGLLTREEFMERMEEIDASDGSPDGKYMGPMDDE